MCNIQKTIESKDCQTLTTRQLYQLEQDSEVVKDLFESWEYLNRCRVSEEERKST